ncbi:MAG: glucose 1-dehydrogenase [Pseudomonadales bacterium]|nr:glucose 1-dehydrogenase [Pseudomonadales bacterium]
MSNPPRSPGTGSGRPVSGRLTGRIALVTGAGSGFGAGIAERFAAEGAAVYVADINLEAATRQAARIGAVAVQLDVRDAASIRAALAEIEAPDILVNNAGIGHEPMPLESLSDDHFEQLFAVNMKSVYLLAKQLVPAMKRSGGVILNIASTAAVSPRPGLTWYNASKGWLVTATKSMAVELAPFGIRVNALNPVAGETPLLATFMGGDTPEHRARFLDSIPLGRFSTPADIAGAASFLCSDDASMITGVALEVDGGRCV